MTLLAPLGLLGLLGVVALIILYIIKPNYQQKFVSSTYIWQLSMKYRKKRVPINKLRNLLLIICQILIITACAFLLAQPGHALEVTENNESIIIIDASASMLTVNSDEQTRFERAVEKAKEIGRQTFVNQGNVTVILAANTASTIMQRVRPSEEELFVSKLDELIENNACSYGVADFDGALDMAENALKDVPDAALYYITDVKYTYIPKDINVVDISDSGEWNAAILKAYTEYIENYYRIVVEVACYGMDKDIPISINVIGANALSKNDFGSTLRFYETAHCSNNETETIIFSTTGAESAQDKNNYSIIGEQDKFFSYQSILVSLDEQDSFEEDNYYQIYGGQKEELKVQYASTLANNFIYNALNAIKNSQDFSARWDMKIDEVRNNASLSAQFATTGYDLYIFEHGDMPDAMPTDGVVVLLDPETAPSGSGFRLSNEREYTNAIYLNSETEHPIMDYVSADKITAKKIRRLASYDSQYEVLMTGDNMPVLMVKNEGASQVVVMLFSVHYSNIANRKDLSILIYNIINYFMPAMIRGNAFEIYGKATVQAMGEEVVVSNNGAEVDTLTEFPYNYQFTETGIYEFSQQTYFGRTITENIYVSIPSSESNIVAVEDYIKSPYRATTTVESFISYLYYFLIALVAVLFVERILRLSEGV